MLPRYTQYTQNPMLINNLTNKLIEEEKKEEEYYSVNKSWCWIILLLLFSFALGISLLLLIINYSLG